MTIYMVSTTTTCQKDECGWPDFGERNFIGWYSNYDDAYKIIAENICDIWEGIYTYAFIEPWNEGTYGFHSNEDIDWFKWDNTLEHYVSISRPEPVEHFCGLTNLNQKRKDDCKSEMMNAAADALEVAEKQIAKQQKQIANLYILLNNRINEIVELEAQIKMDGKEQEDAIN